MILNILSFLSFSLLLSNAAAKRDARLGHTVLTFLSDSNCEFTLQAKEEHAGVLSPLHNYNLCPIFSPRLWDGVHSAHRKGASTGGQDLSVLTKSSCRKPGCSTVHTSRTYISQEIIVGSITSGWPEELTYVKPGDSIIRAVVTATVDATRKWLPPALLLHLKTANGENMAIVHLDCDVAGSSRIESIASSKDTIPIFRWTTPHACPVTDMIITPGTDTVKVLEETSESNENESENDETSDKNLLDIPPRTDFRRSIAITFLTLASCIILIVYLYLSGPPARLQQFMWTYVRPPVAIVVHAVLKPLPNFRVGESRLVRWAQEDMGVLDEEDQMVNGGDAPIDNFEFDEGIPLKPSPWKQAHQTNYGSFGW